MRTTATAFILFSLCLLLTRAWAQGAATDVALKPIADAYYNAQYDQVIQQCSTLLQQKPTDQQRALALLWRGRAYTRKHVMDRAEKDLREAVSLSRQAFGEKSMEHASALTALAGWHRWRGRYQGGGTPLPASP